MKNIQDVIVYQKGYINVCRHILPSPQMHHEMGFHSFFKKCDALQEKVTYAGKCKFTVE